ncbi:MAG TPA: thrombospondin type 3 repeat-containing protein [Candidatus Polarisedimenticolia bacterium]|nr:thrombospondin type 3 repeat-containing protein [Candidatus Polarisedimenticolia bacterium]
MVRNAPRRLFVTVLLCAIPFPPGLAHAAVRARDVGGVTPLPGVESTLAACPGDIDCDGILDGEDDCPMVPDPGQEDADHDLIGDACDLCPTDPTNDADGDGVCGQSDNCPADANPDQGNLDGDGQGDVCDLDDGLIVIRWITPTMMTWQRESGFSDFNVYRRSVADLRATGVYVLDPNSLPGFTDERTCHAASWIPATDPPVGPGEAVAYFVTGSSGGVEGTLGLDSAGNPRPNPHPCGCDTAFVRVLQGADGPPTTQNLMIDNLADWCAFRPSECGRGLIDFSTHVALVSSLAGAICSSTRITCVQSAPGSEVIVRYQTLQPASAACNCITMISNPIDVVTIPRPVARATFEGSVELIPCP